MNRINEQDWIIGFQRTVEPLVNIHPQVLNYAGYAGSPKTSPTWLCVMFSKMISIMSCKPFSRSACLLITDESCSFVSNIVFLVRFVLHLLTDGDKHSKKVCIDMSMTFVKFISKWHRVYSIGILNKNELTILP